jgi:hypothetical protein
MVMKFPHRFAQIIKSLSSTGNMLLNSKISRDCFWSDNLENSRYMIFIDGAKDCMDCNNSGNPSLCYEGVTPDNSYNGLFTIYCWKCSFDFYSCNCHSSNNVFGCVAIKHSEYSIFNKKYSKEEYEKLKEKIIEHMKKTGEWGEFFPYSVCPYGYNETLNIDFFPLNKEEATKKGFSWKEEKEKNYSITLLQNEVPQNIGDVNEDILNEAIECAHGGTCRHKCSTAFKVIEREFQFYKKMNIPIPVLCPNCRYYERLKRRSPAKLWHRQCMCNKGNHFHEEGNPRQDGTRCEVEFETSYSPDRPEIIYCEKCYQQEVY